MDLPFPYLLFTGDARDPLYAKTAYGIRDWRPEACLAQWRLAGGTVDLNLPDMTPNEAVRNGAKAVLIGVAPFGGKVAEDWIAPLCSALEAGLDIVSGLHVRLADVPLIAQAAARHGRTLHDVRHPRHTFDVANGLKRPGKRLLTVGTDCALGKKYTALALTKGFAARAVSATFRATGQTGIMISGGGIAIDAVVSDFIAGAAEYLSPANDADHWDVIEGQGSLLHPAYAGVSLGLLHGSQPDALILCHDPTRTVIDGYPDYPIPPLKAVIELHLAHARRTNRAARFAGIALNTARCSPSERTSTFAAAAAETGLIAFDPLLSDLSPIIDVVLTS